jgi:DNA-binding transcriptional LysR family regulator
MGEALYNLGKAFERFEQVKAAPDALDVNEEILRVGYSRSHLALVAAALATMIGRGKGLKILTTETSPRKVRKLLFEKAIDVGITYPPPSKDRKPEWLEEERLANLPLALVVLKGCKAANALNLADSRELTASKLADAPLALLELDDTDVREEINEYFKKQKPKNVVVEADAATTLLALARQGVPTILPAFPQDEEVFEVIPLTEPVIKTSLLWNKKVPRTPSAHEFADALRCEAPDSLEEYATPELRAAKEQGDST